MKQIKRISFIFGLGLTCGTFLMSCDDNRTGQIVHIDTIEGSWIYNGLSYDVESSFIVATDTIKNDIKKKNKTSEFVIQLTKDNRYIIADHTVLQDSGRYKLSEGKLLFDSKMLEKPYIQSAPIYLNNNDLTLTYDITSSYTEKHLDSLGIESAQNVIVGKAIYFYLFKR